MLVVKPDDLGTSGARAFDVALAQVESMPEPDRFYDAVLRFARAVDMADFVRADWVDRGRPLMYEHTNGALVPHPLVKLLAESEKDAARAGRALKLEPDAIRRATIGRPPGSSSSPDRKAPPPVVKLAKPS
jgi:hypothetical protein